MLISPKFWLNSAAEDEDRDEGRHRVGQDQQQPVDRFAAQVRPLEDRGEQHAEREGEGDRERREDQVQMKIASIGSRMPSEVKMRWKLCQPTLTRQPGGTVSPGLVDVEAARWSGVRMRAIDGRDQPAVGFEDALGLDRGEGAQAGLPDVAPSGSVDGDERTAHRGAARRRAWRASRARRSPGLRGRDGGAVEGDGIGEQAAVAFGQEDAVGAPSRTSANGRSVAGCDDLA